MAKVLIYGYGCDSEEARKHGGVRIESCGVNKFEVILHVEHFPLLGVELVSWIPSPGRSYHSRCPACRPVGASYPTPLTPLLSLRLRQILRELRPCPDSRSPEEEHERYRHEQEGDAREERAGPVEAEVVVELAREEREG